MIDDPAVPSKESDPTIHTTANTKEVARMSEDYQVAKIHHLLIESEIREIESHILNSNQISMKHTPIGKWLFRVFLWAKRLWSVRKNNKRLRHLYQQSEVLHKAWSREVL